MPGFLGDLKQAARGLMRTPSFTATVLVTLALAIGGNAAIFSALRTLVLKPLPFPDADRLVYLWHKNPQMGGVLVTPPRKAIDRWRTATDTFEAVESYSGGSFVLTGTGEPEQISVTAISDTLLPMLGVSPAMGRGIAANDLEASADSVVLISNAFWRDRLGGDPDVIGRTLRLSDTLYTVIGVMPRGFWLPMGSDTLWRPARADARDAAGQNTIAKLRPGVTPAAAQAVLAAMGAPDEDPDLKGWSGAVMTPAEYDGGVGRTLWVLAAAVGMLLLIACVNVANLVLSRNTHRAREVAVRYALGASRGRIVRYFVAEALLLAGAGGVAGVLLALWLVSAMVAMRPRNLLLLERIHVDGAALAFTALVATLTGVVFGLAPAFRAARAGLREAMHRTGRGATSPDRRLRQVLMGLQVAVALVLLVGATLLVRSFGRLLAVDPGFDPSHVVTLRVSLPSSRYGDPDPVVARQKRDAFFQPLLESVSTLPGVASAALGSGVPPETGIMFGTMEIEGRPIRDADSAGQLFSGGYVTPKYFATLRIPVVEGRAFGDIDRLGADRVVIVSRSLARQYFGNGSAVGARLRLDKDDEWATVVGVVGDIRANGLVDGPGRLQIYFSRAQIRPGFGALVVRATGDPAALVPALKARVWALDPRLPVADVLTADQMMARARANARFLLALLGGFSICGLALAAVGVYGVVGLHVGQRRRELGVRMALGASPAMLARLVALQAGRVLAIGLVVGGAAAWWLTSAMRTMLFEVAPRDPWSFALAVVALGAAAALAMAVPIRRAMRVDPAVTLQSE